MSGMDMLLANTLKAFMPKEAAEKILGYANDGTFERIGAIPFELDQIKARQQAIGLQLEEIRNALLAIAGRLDERGHSKIISHGIEPAPDGRYDSVGSIVHENGFAGNT